MKLYRGKPLAFAAAGLLLGSNLLGCAGHGSQASTVGKHVADAGTSENSGLKIQTFKIGPDSGSTFEVEVPSKAKTLVIADLAGTIADSKGNVELVAPKSRGPQTSVQLSQAGVKTIGATIIDLSTRATDHVLSQGENNVQFTRSGGVAADCTQCSEDTGQALISPTPGKWVLKASNPSHTSSMVIGVAVIKDSGLVGGSADRVVETAALSQIGAQGIHGRGSPCSWWVYITLKAACQAVLVVGATYLFTVGLGWVVTLLGRAAISTFASMGCGYFAGRVCDAVQRAS